jgi:CSLREA domain-containing protein
LVAVFAGGGSKSPKRFGEPGDPTGPTAAGSRTFNVNSTADGADSVPGDGDCKAASGGCTLRAAVEEAAVADAPATVEVPAGTYAVSTTIPVSSGSVRVHGADRARTLLDGGDERRVFDIGSGAALTLDNLTLTNGAAEDAGGTVRVIDASLTVKGVTVSSGGAQGHGGGIYAAGSAVSISDSTFDGLSGLAGGAVATDGGDLTIERSMFTESLASDVGGAVAALSPTSLSITGTTFTDNISETHGGALYIGSGTHPKPYVVRGSTFTGNKAYPGPGGAIFTETQLTAEGNTYKDNRAAADTEAGVANNVVTGTEP